MTSAELPGVDADEYSAGFFAATARGTLAVRQCPEGHYLALTQDYSGAAIYCHICGSPGLTWQPVSGAATLVSWVIPHARTGEQARVAGIVELAEGVWMKALIGVEHGADLEVGQQLSVRFVQTPGGQAIPEFYPARPTA
jgi:uncharacterized protein